MLRRLAVDQRGVVAVIMAFTLPVLIGFVGLGFDVGFWYFSRQNMQGAADAAAASAAAALSAGNNTGYVTEAQAIAAQRGLVDGQDGVTVAVTFPYADATTACPTGNNDCLQVVIQKNNEPAMLSSVLGQGNFTIGARSVAVVSHQTYCMLATNSANSNATNVIGIDLSLLLISILDMRNCSIGSNWQGADSLRLVGLGVVGLNAYTATLMGQFDNQCTLCVPGPQWTHPIKTNATPPLAPILDPYQSVLVPTGSPPGSAVSIASQAIPAIPGTCQTAVSVPPAHAPLTPGCYQGVSVSGSGTLTLNAGNYTIYGITLSNTATLTLGAGNYAIYGQNSPAISASGGTLTLGSGTHTIVGSANESALSMSGGTLTLNFGSGTSYIQGGTGAPSINLTGGTLTTTGSASSVIDILGGSGNSAVNMTGGAMTMSGTATSINNILGASGLPAITVGSGGTGGTFTLGDGNSNIQAGCSPPCSPASAITLAGSGNFATVDNTNSTGVVIGPPSPSIYAIQVATQHGICGLGFNCGHDLTLGAGTYTIMGGIDIEVTAPNLTGGNLTLNPTGTGIGTYIIDGGNTTSSVGSCGSSNVGLCMTFGDLNGQNATIVLTGSGSGYAPTFEVASGFSVDGINLTAPQTGPTAGLAVFQNRNNPGGSLPVNSAVGGQSGLGIGFLTVTGALYFPAQSLNFVGVTTDLSNTCLQLIADTLSITGLAFVDDVCTAGVSPIVGIGVAQLVE